jgi:hypothetical protein
LTRSDAGALNRRMKLPGSMRVELGCSRLAATFVLLSHGATAVLLAFAPGNALLRSAGVIVVGGHALWKLRSWALRRTPTAVVAVELAIDGRAVLVERGGRRCEGRVQADSYVGERLTTLVVRLDGVRVSRAVAILPDMLPAEDLRRLRLLLRLHDASA